MNRQIIKQLLKWKDGYGRKPLLIRGARQVGKTHSVKEFGKTYFSGRVFSFNFERNPELHRIFEENLDSNRILSELELLVNKKIIPGDDLLFFDEIQDCPKAIMALRYFFEQNPKLHLIAAGSLIEFALKDISFPVGRIQTMVMYPMTFIEFLVATGNDLLAGKISDAHENLSDTVVEIINKELYNYFIIGGMPECVQTYIDTGSLIDVVQVQTDLITTFRQDFSKYAGHSDKRCLNSVLSSISGRIGKQIKYSHLSEDFSQPTIKKAFELLETARLFTRVQAASPAGIPLKTNTSPKKFKVVFLDIGLLSNLNGYYSTIPIHKQKLSTAFIGMMAEQFVGQELRAVMEKDLFYWNREVRGSSAETDYLIELDGEIFPIEVKSGTSGRLTSLHLLLKTYPGIKTAYVFTENKYGNLPDQKIQFLPLFESQSLAKKQDVTQ